MVALCLQHHKEADAGAFATDQLRSMKAEPFLMRADADVAGRFNWKREQLILSAAGGFYVRCPVLIEISGRPIIWLTADEDGNQLLNLDVWHADGSLAFSMRDNDWIVLGDLEDVEAPPSARSLIVRSRDIRLSVEFAPTTLERIRAELLRREEEANQGLADRYEAERQALKQQGASEMMLSTYEQMIEAMRDAPGQRSDEVVDWIRRAWDRDEFALCTLEAQLPFPYPIHITSTRIVLPGNNVISGGVVVDCGVAIAIN